MTLPKGLSIQTEDGEYNYERGDMLVKSHAVTVTDKTNGNIYVLIKNESGKNFKSTSGTLITLPIVATNVASGTYKIKVTGANIVNLNAQPIIAENAKAFDINVTIEGSDIPEPLIGDVNNDGKVNVADVDFIIEQIGGKYMKQADANNDGKVNVADVDFVIELIK